MNSEKRIPSLDGLRAVSIALVFLCHSVHYTSDDWTDSLRRIIHRKEEPGRTTARSYISASSLTAFICGNNCFHPSVSSGSIAPTLLFAEGSYRFIEQPFLRLRDRILRDDRRRSRPQDVRTGVPRLNEYRDGFISA
jgi:peptidoglycan/LPS O-acetylase OafA/YrhL